MLRFIGLLPSSPALSSRPWSACWFNCTAVRCATTASSATIAPPLMVLVAPLLYPPCFAPPPSPSPSPLPAPCRRFPRRPHRTCGDDSSARVGVSPHRSAASYAAPPRASRSPAPAAASVAVAVVGDTGSAVAESGSTGGGGAAAAAVAGAVVVVVVIARRGESDGAALRGSGGCPTRLEPGRSARPAPS